MKRRILISFTCALALVVAKNAQAQGGHWDGYATLSVSDATFTSATTIEYYPDVYCPDWADGACFWYIAGEHHIDPGFSMPISVSGVSYHGILQAPADPGSCARAWIGVDAIVVIVGRPIDVSYGEWSSNQVCAPQPPPLPQCQLSVSAAGGGSIDPNPTGTYPCGTSVTMTAVPAPGYHFVSWEGAISSSSPTLSFVLSEDMSFLMLFEPDPPDSPPPPPDPDQCQADWELGCNTPIVINFTNGRYLLTGPESPVVFDIRATGHPMLIGWTAAEADEAFLCLDRDYSGMIDSGAELFGNVTPLRDGTPAPNGFAVLAELDDNHDGIIDERDQVWRQLLLWYDLNHNGISEPSEITPVAGSRLEALSLDYHWTGRRDSSGNTFRYQSRAWIKDEARQATPRPLYDIFFATVP